MYLPFEVLVQKTTKKSDVKSILKNLKTSNLSVRTEKKLLKEEKTYDQSCLKRLLPHYDFYLNKNISKLTLLDFKCGLAHSGPMYQRMVFPVLRDDKRIHGFSGRKRCSAVGIDTPA